MNRSNRGVARMGSGMTCALLMAVALLIPGIIAAQLLPDTPAGKFRLPVFDEETGYRVWEIQGDEARFKSSFEVEVVEMQLRVFSGGVHVTNTISGPLAHIFPAARRAFGDGVIRVEGPGYTIDGEDWVWDGTGAAASIEVNRAVQVAFLEPIDSLLR